MVMEHYLSLAVKAIFVETWHSPTSGMYILGVLKKVDASIGVALRLSLFWASPAQ